MQGEAMTAGAVLKILARSNPQDGRGDLAWITTLAGMLDDMLQGYALVQAIDNVDQLSGLPGGTEVYSSDERTVLIKSGNGYWLAPGHGALTEVEPQDVLSWYGGLFTVHVPQD